MCCRCPIVPGVTGGEGKKVTTSSVSAWMPSWGRVHSKNTQKYFPKPPQQISPMITKIKSTEYRDSVARTPE